ncbi:MAG: TetR family transcriptional regulator [Marinobacterium sp.]|nr:TetR family transcriptional regulator [Marinobacterium sp.]
MRYLPKEEKRKAILEATLNLAASCGFAGITARKVATAMGTATGTIHHHFSSLSELKCEVVRYALEITCEKEKQAVKGLSPYEALIQLLLPSNMPDREFDTRVWNSAADEIWRNEAFKQEYSRAMRIYTGNLEAIIQRGCDEGAFTPVLSPRQCAWKLLATAFNLSDYTYLEDPDFDIDTANNIILQDIQVTLAIQPGDQTKPPQAVKNKTPR